MTRILSLGQNNGITIMILNLAPLKSYHLDTLSSLNVSSRAKRIEVREIENEVVFTQPPRKAAPLTGTSIQRQPLRPLAHAHNTHINAGAQKGDKPAKAFSVYTDKSKPSGPRSSNAAPQTVRRANSTGKRASDTVNNPRPTKIVRPNPTGVKSTAEISSAKIEELIERKVQEALASRAQEQPVANTSNEISEAVQRRLEALEKRVENGEAEDDARAEGLRFLLMAKQHKERGEDVSALKMYELAIPFFPGQERLQKKIDGLKAKIAAKREAVMKPLFVPEPEAKRVVAATIMQLPTPLNSFEAPEMEAEERPMAKQRKSRISTDSDADFNASAIIQADDYEDDDSLAYKPSKSKKPKAKAASKSTLRIFADNFDANAPLTPKTRQLLDIVNSRDLELIKGLKGVGAKKANDLVEFLELRNEDDGGNIRTLQQLEAVPGLGKATVDKAYKGISMLFV
jgi:DNA uptake protein ComE-like DNA-binding protein